MVNKNLIKKFDKTNNLIIISEYLPVQKASTGLGWYTSNTQKSLISRRTIIITNKIGKKDEVYEENGALIVRCFNKQRPLSLLRMVGYASKLVKVNSILFEFEFASFGNILSVSVIPFIIFLLKLLGKKVYFTLHQVTNNLKRLHSHLGLSKSSSFILILNIGLSLFYRSIGIFAYKIIVLEEEFRQRISKYVDINKISFIPIGINKLLTKNNSRLRTKMNLNKNDFVIMVFGYVAWYKGIDRLIESFNGLPNKIKGKNLKLIIAGGYSQAQAGKSHYEKYYQSIKNQAYENKKISITGFVPEDQVVNYYSIADLCLVPYREFISSSGPLSLALSYRKPVVLSSELKGYMKSADFSKAMELAHLKKNDLFVNISENNLKNIINRLITDNKYKKQVINFSLIIDNLRNWKQIGHCYNKIMKENKKRSFVLPKFNFNFGQKILQVTTS